ncbi:hypothetical protein DB31_5956 [Hyalangium minutum]|uniref:Uncharacterized protein n=1 Tax=Hyalangium minutum TaxID=394096 RepID=A0A085VYV4_9BACT|nr:hypothetical protein DB31_5956 [Hyalangium minutum]
MGGSRLPEELYSNTSAELIATELQIPVELLKLSAEGLVEELRTHPGDPLELSAAETLVHSAEKMRRIVQALLDALQAEQP